MKKINDESIVRGLKLGEADSFTHMYEKYSSLLLKQIYALTKNKEKAEEILHESFIIAITKINFYKPNKESSLKSWLLRIAINKSIDYLRSIKNSETDHDFHTCETTEGQYLEKEANFLIQTEFKALPPVQRSVISLRVLEDLSYMEISRVLGISLPSVKQAIFKGKKTLKSKFETSEWCYDRI